MLSQHITNYDVYTQVQVFVVQQLINSLEVRIGSKNRNTFDLQNRR